MKTSPISTWIFNLFFWRRYLPWSLDRYSKNSRLALDKLPIFFSIFCNTKSFSLLSLSKNFNWSASFPQSSSAIISWAFEIEISCFSLIFGILLDLTISFPSGNILAKSSENLTFFAVVFSWGCRAKLQFSPTATASFSLCGLIKRNFCVGVNFSSSESNSLSNSLFFGGKECGVGRRGKSLFQSSSSSLSSSSLLCLLLIFITF